MGVWQSPVTLGTRPVVTTGASATAKAEDFPVTPTLCKRGVRSWQDREHEADPAVPGGHQWPALMDRAAGAGGHPDPGR